MRPRPRLTGDDWTDADDPAYADRRSAHQIEVHVPGIDCKCLPSLVFGVDPSTGATAIGIDHVLHSWPARVRRVEGGHP